MSYTHLTTTERVKIETYLELGMSIRSIARRIGRQPSTVSREIRRNPGYESGRAQKRYEKAKTHCGAKTKLDDTMRRTIVEKLRATWSPEQIVGRLYTGKIAFSTIYRWIYAGRIDVPVYKCQLFYVQFCSFNNVQYCRFRQTPFVPSGGPSIDMSPRISARQSHGEESGPRWRLPVSGLRTLPPTNRN